MRERLWLARAGGTAALVLVFLGGLVGGLIYRHHRPRPIRPYLIVAFLDVGRGDCTLIRTPNGHAILVDTGPAEAAPLLVQTLRQQKVQALDLLVLAATAPNSVGGLPILLSKSFPIARVWACPGLQAEGTQRNVLQAYRIPCQFAHVGDSISIDGAQFTAVWPPASKSLSLNANLVCRLDYGSAGFVLAGPMNTKTINHLVADAGDTLNCDVLQVAAGGADGATTPELLRRATPSIAVISCAGDSVPGNLTLHRLAVAGAAVYRTDTKGAITIFTDGRDAPLVTVTKLTGG